MGKMDASVQFPPGEDISIALQHYLEAEIQRRKMPDTIAPADFLKILLSSGANTQVQGEHEVRPYAGCGVPADRNFLDRIAQVAYERYTARRIAQDVPTLIIVPAPLTRRQTNELLGSRLNYVMIFGAESIYFQDTVHALAVDSGGIRVRSACDCSRGVNVLGAHIDWISSDGRSVERALAVDKTGLVKEAAFDVPVPIHIVQILHLPLKRERQLHRELSIYFRDRGIPQINPYEGSSERADDKAWTHALWDQYGQKIVSPKYTLIPQRGSPEEIVARLRAFIENTRKPSLVVQPNRGTEGCKVERFGVGADSKSASSSLEGRTVREKPSSPPFPKGDLEGFPKYEASIKSPLTPLSKGGVRGLSLYKRGGRKMPGLEPSSPIVKYIRDQILPEDDAIMREERGNVRYGRDTAYRAPTQFLDVAFRINVAWNGSEFVAESGYAQVAKDDRTFPASRGRAGAIVDINEVLANLYYPRDGSLSLRFAQGQASNEVKEWIRFIPTDEDIAAMKVAATSAAYGLNAGLNVEDYLKLMGIDILLEVQETEANIINVIPVVLEANPRPAGLSCSSEIIGISDKKPQPRISTEIFRFLGSIGL